MSETTLKCVLLGDSGVGKTSISSMYINGKMNPDIKPTVGAAFAKKFINVNDKSVELLLWDTAGQECYRGLAPMYYRSASIAIITFDITNQKSFESVDYWVNELLTNTQNTPEIILCANKCDLEESRVIGEEAIENYAETHGNLSFFSVSAMTGIGISQLFESAINQCLSKTSSPEVVRPVITEQTVKKEGCC